MRSSVILGLLLALGGCSSPTTESAIPACPRVGILSDAATMVQFQPGNGRDPSDVLFEAEMAGVVGECIYDRRRTNVTIDMKLRINGARGPADRNRTGDFTYFIAILDQTSEVVARQEFRSRLDFPPNVARVATVEELEQKIPLPNGKAGSDFEVLVGFKLTPDQLERNRAGLR